MKVDKTISDELLALLPERVLELIEVVGMTAALALVEAHGGTHIWVPKKAKAEHWLDGLIGREAFEKLCAYYDSNQLEIPLCKRLRQHLMVIEFDQGASNNQLARKYHTTDRNVRRIRKRIGAVGPSANLDLFRDFL